MHAANPKAPGRRVSGGFTLIELMVALSIGLFLTGALLTIVQTNRRVFGEQNQLAQMQDNERMALTMMGDVIQSAGYFPLGNPPLYVPVNTLTTSLTPAPPFGIGQAIAGNASGTPFGDQIQVRYMTAGGDGILNCSGLSNPVGGPNTLYVNNFQLVGGQLVCVMNGTPYTLVGGATGSGLDITNMSILYGVKANAANPGNNVDTYMTAAAVTLNSLWSNVISVQITLTFTNPLAGNPGQPANFQITRVIGVMSQTGPTI